MLVMKSTLVFFVLIPLLGFLVSLIIPKKKENLLSGAAYITAGSHLLFGLAYLCFWLLNGHQVIDLKSFIVYESVGYEFFIDFYFDKVTAVYLLVGSFLTFMVTTYSRYYLHRERGYKRFFNSILFFYLGYNIVIFSGNLETLFVGWEVLGIASFLLIAFYRDRYLPVKNALKVFSVYRIADVGLILAMWLSHHLWHENITFSRLSDMTAVTEHLHHHSYIGVFISLSILLAAAAKSAQMPFSYWLSRAMEGPTPSSAIFYGSLSVHLGAFLLLRTFSFWEYQPSVRIIIIVLGLMTSIIATGIARVQSSVKSQIAYSSIAQIGIIFIEIALGFEKIALFHFAGNAFLRTYQLLVSPSIVSYLIKEQFYNFTPRSITFEDTLPRKMEYSFYMLCLKEFNMDNLMSRFLWKPLKIIGSKLTFLTLKGTLYFIPSYLIGLYVVYNEKLISKNVLEWLPYLFSIIALGLVLKSFVEQKDAKLAWVLLVFNHFWLVLAISFNEHFGFDHVHLYLSGVLFFGVLGYLSILELNSLEKLNVDLIKYQGYSRNHPKLAFLFLFSCLGVSCFPITPSFIGVDLIFSHVHENQVVLIVISSFCFILTGISAIRIYARVFLGPNEKSGFINYKSS